MFKRENKSFRIFAVTDKIENLSQKVSSKEREKERKEGRKKESEKENKKKEKRKKHERFHSLRIELEDIQKSTSRDFFIIALLMNFKISRSRMRYRLRMLLCVAR